MKKHQDKRDILKGFYDYLKSNDIKIIKQTNSKSYVNNKPHNGENDTTLVNFHYEMKHISDKDIDSWFTVGVNPNIVEASFQALMDSINYKLIKEGAPIKKSD